MLKPVAVCLLSFVAIASGDCPDGFLHHGVSCYHFSHDTEDWTNARALCKYLGAELAEIDDAREDQFLMAQVQQFPHRRYWVGGNDLAVETDWVWEDSKKTIANFTYSNWGPGEPNNDGGNGNCLELVATSPGVKQYWNDAPCKVTDRYYICEKPIGEVESIIG